MKMSQSEILKDSVSDWPINMPGVSKRTRGNGRNGTEQRALEGVWNSSEWRGRMCRRGPGTHCGGEWHAVLAKTIQPRRCTDVGWSLEPSHRKLSRLAERELWKNWGEVVRKKKKRPDQAVGKRPWAEWVQELRSRERLKISPLPSHNYACSDAKNALSKPEAGSS